MQYSSKDYQSKHKIELVPIRVLGFQFLKVEQHHLFVLIYTRSLADCMAKILDTQDPQEIADELCALTYKQV